VKAENGDSFILIQRLQSLHQSKELRAGEGSILVYLLLLLGVPVEYYARQAFQQQSTLYELVVQMSLTWFNSR
jgi:hypothetical protein